MTELGDRTIYVTRDGATLRREGERLLVRVKQVTVAELPVRSMRQLVLAGNVTLTPAALDMIVSRGIDCVLISHSGRYRGRIVSGSSGNIRLRLAQYRAFSYEPRALEIAREIVSGKIANQRALVMRHARRHGEDDRLHRARLALAASAVRATHATTLDELRGCEGAASAAYFRDFGALLRAPGFSFDGRNRRPPLDPVNALLSLGYTLLANAVEAAVQIVGMDPYLGTLHAPVAGRPSLPCDLMEELRAPIVDALVIAAINQQAFEPNDFEDVGPGEPVVIKRDAMRWLITLLERRLARPTHYSPLGKQLPWRMIIEQQARCMAREVLGEERYRAYTMR
jgi:CRISPR-associated protein Cas1